MFYFFSQCDIFSAKLYEFLHIIIDYLIIIISQSLVYFSIKFATVFI